MADCRFYLMSHEDHIIGVRFGTYEAREDAERRAVEILRDSPYWIDAVEGWERAQRLCRVIRNHAEAEKPPRQFSFADAVARETLRK